MTFFDVRIEILTLYTVACYGRVDTWPGNDRARWTREVGPVISSGQRPRQTAHSSAELDGGRRQSGPRAVDRWTVAVPGHRRRRVASSRRTRPNDRAAFTHVSFRRVRIQLRDCRTHYVTQRHLHHQQPTYTAHKNSINRVRARLPAGGMPPTKLSKFR